MENYNDIATELSSITGNYGKVEESLQMMEIKRLERIAEALEGINSNLSDISLSLDSLEKNIDSCIATNGRNKFLCITGNISNY